jgi:myo-inositol-1(or 4)-monophosphatase
MTPMHSSDLDADLALARRAARQAGALVMRHFRSAPEVHFKAPDQPVTLADLEADRALRELLLGERPHYGWLSEESEDSRARLSRSRVWVVDPIDGTNSFVAGRPDFVVSVGLVQDGVAVAGVVLNPASGALYEARRGGGARRDGEPIRVATRLPAGARGIMLASPTEVANGGLDPYRGAWDVVPLGSTAHRMVRVADGAGHLFFSRRGRQEWDVCAAALILEEAGGVATHADGTPFRFNQPRPTVAGIAARSGDWIALPPARLDGPPENHGRS